MRIALADDHALFRAGLRSTLIDAFGPRVRVAEAEDFEELAGLLTGHDEFDLVLCDTAIPGIDVCNGVGYLASLCPDTPLVMVSAREDPAEACSAIEQGARGYVQKSESLAVLQHALELVLAGGLYVPALVLLRQHRLDSERPAPGSAPSAALMAKLSARQLMIFERLADGSPNKLIARELGIAEGTVKAQVRAIFRKLGVQNRTQAALFAAEVLGRPGRDGGAPRAGNVGEVQDLSAISSQPLSFQPARGGTLKIVTSRH